MNRRSTIIYLSAAGLLLAIVGIWYARAYTLDRQRAADHFNGNRAYADVQTQYAFGPRIPGSDAHARALDWMRSELEAAGWQVDLQQSVMMGHPVQNLVATRGSQTPVILLGAHYDSRLWADNDPNPANRTQPVPGADDGGSGVAVLLELARTLPEDTVPVELAFFDAEDNGKIPGWDWLLGSKAFIANMNSKPREMILLDMVGETGLSIPMEGNSDPALRTSIWDTAAKLGYGKVFIPQVKYNIEDDHLPFIQAGIPSVDIIDIDYTYWHTISDTPDHVSAQSLQIVGDVLWTWLVQQN